MKVTITTISSKEQLMVLEIDPNATLYDLIVNIDKLRTASNLDPIYQYSYNDALLNVVDWDKPLHQILDADGEKTLRVSFELSEKAQHNFSLAVLNVRAKLRRHMQKQLKKEESAEQRPQELENWTSHMPTPGEWPFVRAVKSHKSNISGCYISGVGREKQIHILYQCFREALRVQNQKQCTPGELEDELSALANLCRYTSLEDLGSAAIKLRWVSPDNILGLNAVLLRGLEECSTSEEIKALNIELKQKEEDWFTAHASACRFRWSQSNPKFRLGDDGICQAVNFGWILAMLKQPNRSINGIEDLGMTVDKEGLPNLARARFLQSAHMVDTVVGGGIPKSLLKREHAEENPILLKKEDLCSVDKLLDQIKTRDLGVSAGIVEIGLKKGESHRGHAIGLRVDDKSGQYAFWDCNLGFWAFSSEANLRTALKGFFSTCYLGYTVMCISQYTLTPPAKQEDKALEARLKLFSPATIEHLESKESQNIDLPQKNPKNKPGGPHFRRSGLG